MIAPWLLYASAIGCVIVLVSVLLERVARWHNWPARWIWVMAIATIVALPIALNLMLRTTVVPHAAASGAPSLSPATPSFDTSLLVGWLTGSLLLSLRIAGSALALRRRRAAWIPLDVGGEQVLVSERLGPAVIGWTKLTTVIPRWALMLDEHSRTLMLQHEAEHARAGDPHLQVFGLLALVMMPWNLALWWSLRRLRLAVEVDCDRRLLAQGADPRLYASVLLAVGERMSTMPFAWATALGGSPSSLETRIIAMSSSCRPRHYRLAISGATLAAAGLVAIACASSVPDSIMPPSAPAVTSKPTPATRVTVSAACAGAADCIRDEMGYAVYRAKFGSDACYADRSCAASADSERKVAEHVPIYRGKGDTVGDWTMEAHASNGAVIARVSVHAGDERAIAKAIANLRDSVRARP